MNVKSLDETLKTLLTFYAPFNVTWVICHHSKALIDGARGGGAMAVPYLRPSVAPSTLLAAPCLMSVASKLATALKPSLVTGDPPLKPAAPAGAKLALPLKAPTKR